MHHDDRGHDALRHHVMIKGLRAELIHECSVDSLLSECWRNEEWVLSTTTTTKVPNKPADIHQLDLIMHDFSLP